jgi:hypothetical protein
MEAIAMAIATVPPHAMLGDRIFPIVRPCFRPSLHSVQDVSGNPDAFEDMNVFSTRKTRNWTASK